MQGLKKDFVVHRDRTNLEVNQGVEMIRTTREDYIQRIKDIYDDQARIVRETQLALNTTRDTVDNQARSVSNDNKVNSKMLMTFETNLSNFALEARSNKDTMTHLLAESTKQNEKLMSVEANYSTIQLGLQQLGRSFAERNG